MANLPTSDYMVLEPIFQKVVRTINSSKTKEQYRAAKRYACNYLNYLEYQVFEGKRERSLIKEILIKYYGQEINRLIKLHPLFKL